MRANTTHLVQMEGSPSSRCGDANAGQSFVGDFVRICRSRTQYSHMRGCTDVATLKTGQE